MQFHLVLFSQCPGFDAARAQIAGKCSGEAVKRKYSAWPNKVDVPNQIVVIGMVRERKCCVNLIAIDGIWIDGPATNHRDAFAWNSFQHVRPIRAGRADQNFSCNIIRPVTHVFTKRLPELFVDARHLVNGAVEHGSQSDTVE